MEFKRWIESGIIGTPISKNITPDNNKPNTKYIYNPIDKHSSNKLSTHFGI